MVKCLDRVLDGVFSALADPTRREIVRRLAEGPSRVTDMASHFDMSLPAVSKHLRILEGVGLLHRDRVGRVHRLTLKADRMRDAMDWLEHYKVFWGTKLDALSDYLENEKPPRRR